MRTNLVLYYGHRCSSDSKSLFFTSVCYTYLCSDKLSVPKTRNRLATFDADMNDMSTTDHSAPSQNTIALMQPHKGENGRVSESEYNSPGQATGLETHIPVYSSSEESGSVSCFIEEH